MKIQINTQKALQNRNSLLEMLGFEADEVEATTASLNIENTFDKYGYMVLTPFEHGFEVTFEKQDLYINDLNNAPVGTFVGE
jgi:hypothetical protein